MPTKYVYCDCHNKYEALDKEEVYDAIAEATGNTPSGVDSAFITKIKEMNANSQLKFWVGTTAQFNAITTKAADTLYILTDDDTADDLDSIAENMQGIIDGEITVPNATHATSADSATTAAACTGNAATATTATTATNLSGSRISTYSDGDKGIIKLFESGTETITLSARHNDDMSTNEFEIKFYSNEVLQKTITFDHDGYSTGLIVEQALACSGNAATANKVVTQEITPTAVITRCGLYAVTVNKTVTGLSINKRFTAMLSIENLTQDAYVDFPYVDTDGILTYVDINYNAATHTVGDAYGTIAPTSIRLITEYQEDRK